MTKTEIKEKLLNLQEYIRTDSNNPQVLDNVSTRLNTIIQELKTETTNKKK